jgi:hypothetical protein
MHGGGGHSKCKKIYVSPVNFGIEKYEHGKREDPEDDESAPVVVVGVDGVHSHRGDLDVRTELKKEGKRSLTLKFLFTFFLKVERTKYEESGKRNCIALVVLLLSFLLPLEPCEKPRPKPKQIGFQ